MELARLYIVLSTPRCKAMIHSLASNAALNHQWMGWILKHYFCKIQKENWLPPKKQNSMYKSKLSDSIMTFRHSKTPWSLAFSQALMVALKTMMSLEEKKAKTQMPSALKNIHVGKCASENSHRNRWLWWCNYLHYLPISNMNFQYIFHVLVDQQWYPSQPTFQIWESRCESIHVDMAFEALRCCKCLCLS